MCQHVFEPKREQGSDYFNTILNDSLLLLKPTIKQNTEILENVISAMKLKFCIRQV